MLSLIRVDDRLVHGQVTTTWVPYMDADTILVASDEVASNHMRRTVIGCCAYKGLRILVLNIDEALKAARGDSLVDSKVILIVQGLEDALRIFDGGLVFDSLNIGNIHDDCGQCRSITPSVCLDEKDEEILERFAHSGVKIDLRDVPTTKPVIYTRRAL